MNGVVAMAELLVESGVSEEQALYVQTIRNSGEALLTIINDVLDFSKIEANKLELRPRPFDLERTIHEIMTLLQPTAKGKEIELVVDYDMFLPTSFVGDPGRVRQVLTNLIGNAVKFTPSGHVMVRTVGLPAEGNAHRIHITVEDTGIGIGDEQLEHIFGEFNQAESSKSRSFDGTGLGLAISRQLVRLMGGEVWVDSELGKGSSFGFHLVLPEAEGPAAADVTRPDWIDRAFIIDKSAAARPILEKQLRAVGISPITCDAVEEFERMDPTPNDLVIVAHDPPRIDAVALSKRLVAEARSSAILILSGGILTLDPALKSHVSVRQRPVLRSEIWEHLAALKKHSPVALAVPESEPASDITEVQTASSSGHQERRRIRVLAAEDNKTNQLIFSKMLKTLDIELTFANNGREAVEGFLKDRPDIIFTDISMPEMDGKEATRRIRKLEAEADARPVPIVAMTAHAMDSDEIEILASGVDRCLTKPLKKADLVEAIVDAAPEGTLPAISEGATADVA
ncbi:MAG: ATP-binding protein [Pseudomonadota bacterium]